MLQLTPCRTSAYSMLGFWFRHAICLIIIQLVWYNPDLRTLQSHTTISMSLWHHPTPPGATPGALTPLGGKLWSHGDILHHKKMFLASRCYLTPLLPLEIRNTGSQVDTVSRELDQVKVLPIQTFQDPAILDWRSLPLLGPPRGNSEDPTDGDVPYSRPIQYLDLSL